MSALFERRTCEPHLMIFGDHMTAPESVAAAEWIAPACNGSEWTVGALVPNEYPRIARLWAPETRPTGWWSEYRHLYEVVASIGERHTSSSDRAWFAVWEGHGFDTVTTRVAWRDPALDDATRRLRDEYRSQLRGEDDRRNAALRTALLHVPRFHLPHRSYYLLRGAVSSVTQLCHPEPRGEWRNPDLFWPDDRRWFVATDVDFWSLYVGGDHDFIAELIREVPTRSEVVELGRALEVES